jgi:hypothetical protein
MWRLAAFSSSGGRSNVRRGGRPIVQRTNPDGNADSASIDSVRAADRTDSVAAAVNEIPDFSTFLTILSLF